jgi:hypothetical protein
MKLPAVIVAAIMVNMLSSLGSAAATCESLTALKLPDTAIRLAQTVAAGALDPPSSFPAPGPRGGGKGARPGHRIAHPGREDGTDSAPMSLPTGGEVQGNWKHGRRRKLLLLSPEIADATSLVVTVAISPAIEAPDWSATRK